MGDSARMLWQGSTNCSILLSQMGEHGVSWENMENIEMFSSSLTEVLSGSPTQMFSGSPTEVLLKGLAEKVKAHGPVNACLLDGQSFVNSVDNIPNEKLEEAFTKFLKSFEHC